MASRPALKLPAGPASGRTRRKSIRPVIVISGPEAPIQRFIVSWPASRARDSHALARIAEHVKRKVPSLEILMADGKMT